LERWYGNSRWRFLWKKKANAEPRDVATEADLSDLPKVVATKTYGGLSGGSGAMSLGFGSYHAGGSHWGADLFDVLLPVMLIAGALFFADRTFKWNIGKYVNWGNGISSGSTAPADAGASFATSGTGLGNPGATAPKAAEGTRQRASQLVPVTLDIDVDSDGTPRWISVVKSGPGLADVHAINEARTLKFPIPKPGADLHIKITLNVPID
jgi:hypothetical protein